MTMPTNPVEPVEVALLPCPFCGGEALMHQGPFIGRRSGWWVSCVGLNCRTAPRTKALTQDEAAAKWNTRLAAKQPAGALHAPTVEAVLRVVDREYNGRVAQCQTAKAGGLKKEARDYETMAIALSQARAAICSLSKNEGIVTHD